jgi:hypothetical protein
MIYATVQAFLASPSNPSAGRSTWVYFGLLQIPDLLSVGIYTICGLFLPKATAPAGQTAQSGGYYEPGKDGTPASDTPYTASDQGAYQQYQQQPMAGGGRRNRRRMGGPIHMLISAIMESRQK